MAEQIVTPGNLPYLISGVITVVGAIIFALGRLHSSTQVRRFDRGSIFIWGGISFMAFVAFPGTFAWYAHLDRGFSVGLNILSVIGGGYLIGTLYYGLSEYQFASYPLHESISTDGRIRNLINRFNLLTYSRRVSVQSVYLFLVNFYILSALISYVYGFGDGPSYLQVSVASTIFSVYLLSVLLSVAHQGYSERKEYWVKVSPEAHSDSQREGLLVEWQDYLHLTRSGKEDLVINFDTVDEFEILDEVDGNWEDKDE